MADAVDIPENGILFACVRCGQMISITARIDSLTVTHFDDMLRYNVKIEPVTVDHRCRRRG